MGLLIKKGNLFFFLGILNFQGWHWKQFSNASPRQPAILFVPLAAFLPGVFRFSFLTERKGANSDVPQQERLQDIRRQPAPGHTHEGHPGSVLQVREGHVRRPEEQTRPSVRVRRVRGCEGCRRRRPRQGRLRLRRLPPEGRVPEGRWAGRLQGRPGRRRRPRTELEGAAGAPIAVPGPGHRSAAVGLVAGPEGPHEGGGRRLLRRRVQGRVGRRRVPALRGHEVRDQEARRFKIQISRGRSLLHPREGGQGRQRPAVGW